MVSFVLFALGSVAVVGGVVAVPLSSGDDCVVDPAVTPQLLTICLLRLLLHMPVCVLWFSVIILICKITL